jgi:hypothetical protein
MRARAFALLALASGAVASPVLAQGSTFALRGLGWAARPVSARSAGTAGALALLDPEMAANPAALTRWRSVAAWAVAAPTKRSYDSPTGSAEQQTVRFPLFGFAAVLPPRLVFGFSISDYLDRTWTLQQQDSILLRNQMETFTDAGRSIGGVSDLQLGAGYRVTQALSVGLAFHYYLGSTRLTAQRSFINVSYQQILEQSLTDFRGAGVGAGLLWSLPRLDIAASARLNGSLRSHNSSGQIAHTHLPPQLAVGLRWHVVPGVFFAGTAQYDGWGRAAADLAGTGQETARNVWTFAAGVEVPRVTLIKLHTPLRAGYRTRTLPFTSLGQEIHEHAVAGGFGFVLARDRTTIDIGFESGDRKAGVAREKFRSIFVGLTVRP